MGVYPGAMVRLFVYTTLTLVAPLLASVATAATATLPDRVHAQLQRMMPSVARAIAQDPDLLREVGAREAEDLAAATFDFSREVRFFHLDIKTVGGANELREAMTPTDQYCMPYCVNGRCRTLMCFRYSGETHRTSLLSVGRSEQAARLADALARTSKLLPGSPRPHAVVTLGDREFLHTYAAGKKAEYLLPLRATGDQSAPALMTLADTKAAAEALAESTAYQETPRNLMAADLKAGAIPDADRSGDELVSAEEPTSTSGMLDTAYAATADDAGLAESVDAPATSRGGQSATAMVQRALLLVVGLTLVAIRFRKKRLAAL